ncbi:MAG: phosphotransferase [Alphaproteobacteria bacterium]|nr:phosphotransferase [Alphaproteobacteria bacterium]
MGKGIDKNAVLAHCDLNPTNLLLDSNLNIVSIIDWDSMAIVSDVNKDEDGFENLWEKYKKSV